MKHTPGPWEAHTGRANTSVYAGSYAVAVGCKEDDAALIAAAPDLLAAIRRFLDSEREQSEGIRSQAAALARAAVAKAEHRYL